jgi:HK97 family phage major capsid protein
MKLTPKLKSWCVLHMEVDADASDAVFKKAVGEALSDELLTDEQFLKLSKTKNDEDAEDFNGMMKQFGGALNELTDLLKEEKGDKKSKGKRPIVDDDDEDEEEDEKSTLQDEEEDDDEEEVPVKSKKTPKSKKEAPTKLEKMISSMSMPTGIEQSEKSISIRVKEAADSYSKTKSGLVFPGATKSGKIHPLAGRPVTDFSDPSMGARQLESASDLDLAVCGAFSKFMCQIARVKSRSLAFMQMPQHDKELLMYAMEHMAWGGSTTGDNFADIKGRKLFELEQKALIDDGVSGGLEAAPIVFDDLVIQTPLLNGELFPLVNSVPIDRGRRIEGVATGTVTGGWGGVDDTDIALFSTASYVTAFDTTIFRWEGAIEIGLDFMSDTPIDFAQHVTAQYGERLLEDLDDVIATGNGTTQPEGITVKAGTTSISFGGSTTIGGYESLRFGVAKPEHKGNASTAVFCGTEQSYMRAKAIPVGASDARRLSNTVSMPGYDDYSWMERPYKINESLGNTKIFYAILGRYRMYRRRGLTMRTSTEGKTLIRKNAMLISCTARYGGQLERGAVAAVTSTAPA